MYWGLADKPVNNVVITSNEQQKDSAIHIHVSILLRVVLEKTLEREAWCAAVHEVAKSRTQLSDFTSFHFSFMGTKKLGAF